MRLKHGKWSSKYVTATFDENRFVPWLGLTQSKSNIEQVEAEMKTMELMKMCCAKSSRRRLC